jgi:hypothetical protein
MANLESDILRKIREWPKNHPRFKLEVVLLFLLLLAALMFNVL